MSRIQKLKIRGVRSFPENTPAVIELCTPLTLIVGQNGTGKTTIVEALKYATAGSLPPNSKNGAFVHDPRLGQSSETRAQVMMKFTSCEGKELIVARGMSQILGKSKSETKTLESALWEVQGQERKLICNKLADLDVEVPLLLGTSAAVLENVVFCHQEDGAWPLGDPSVVKKKLDGIFSSSKFVKALEGLKGLKKDKAAEVKLMKCKHEALQERVQIKRRIEQRVERSRGRVEALEKKMEAASGRGRELAGEKREREREYEEALRRLRNKERAVSELQGLSTKSLLDIPKEEIEKLLNKQIAMERPEGVEREIEEARRECAGVEKKIERYKELRRRSEMSKEEVRALKKEIEESVAHARKELIRENETVWRMYGRLSKLLGGAAGGRFEEVREEEEYEAIAKKTRENVETLKQEKRKAEETVDEKKSEKGKDFEKQTEDLGALKEKLKAAEEALEQIEEKLAYAQDGSEEIYATEIEEQRRIAEREHETEAGSRDAKKAVISRIEEIQAQMEIALGEVEARKEKELLEKEIERKLDDLSYIPHPHELSRAPSAEEILKLEEKTRTEHRAVQERLQHARGQEHLSRKREIERYGRELAQKEMEKHRSARAEELLQKIETEIRIEGAEQAATKQEVLKKIKERKTVRIDTKRCENRKKEDLRERIGGLRASESIYTEFLNRAHAKQGQGECPFCSERLSASASGRCADKIEEILRQIGGRKKAVQGELEKETEKEKLIETDALIKAQINEVGLFELREEGEEGGEARGEWKVQEWEISRESLEKKLAHVREIREKHAEISALRKRAGEIAVSENNYQEVCRQHREAMGALQRIEEKEAQEEKRRAEREKEAEQARKRIKEIEDLLMKKNMYREEMGSLEKQKFSLESKKHGIRTRLLAKEKEIDAAKREEEELDRIKAEIKKISTDSSAEVTVITTERKISDTARKIKSLGEVQFTEGDKIKEEELLRQKSLLEEHVRVMEEHVRAHEEAQARVQLLKDSIRARVLRESIENTHVTQGTVEEIQQEIREREAQIEEQQKTAAEAGGEAQNLKTSMKEDGKELHGYADAEKEECSSYIRIKVVRDSLTDLDKYLKGVESAIVTYHSEKLAEVNAIIEEIWGMTYKGGEIEKIKIVSEPGKSYTLMMEKNGVEIEMRGRVSAGQKMLASIVVRLALAEAFSTNCGLLSLDEPTTNLDRANIAGLARALSAIIQARRAEGGFQLLVITHDEDFVRELLRTECTEYFYKIERDARMVPKIEKLSIYD